MERAAAAHPALREIRTNDVNGLTASLLAQGNIVGWFQGGSELGPRALGQRSILRDPRRPDAKETLNQRVKHREAFRPFAPTVPVSDAPRYFDFGTSVAESPFMLRVCSFHPERRNEVTGVVHVNGTGRVQTLDPADCAPFHGLVRAFGDITGVPVLLNTSFNVMGKPIVETPRHALACMAETGIDACAFTDRVYVKQHVRT